MPYLPPVRWLNQFQSDPMHHATLKVRPQWLTFVFLPSMIFGGCESQSPDAVPAAVEQAAEAPTPTAPALRVSNDPQSMTIAELRKRLAIGDAGQITKIGGRIVGMDLQGTPVKDLAALTGLPLQELYLEDTAVSDLSPLAGMPLEKLYLSRTQVTDLSPLQGMQLEELNLVGALVTDISPLKDVEIRTLWLPETRVADLSPLAGKAILSLDVRDTPVSDLTPLAGNDTLRRLHIAGTNVTDLTPLAGLQLERLVFTPSRIEQGVDAIREMTSLQALDTVFDGVAPVKTPEEFWRQYDADHLGR